MSDSQDELIHAPVAIGGLGGSGTRVVAQALHDLGIFMGADLNRQYDNLWFAFLFGRRDILLSDPDEFSRLADLFCRQMSDPRPLDSEDMVALRACLETERLQHDPEFLRDQFQNFLAYGKHGAPQRAWGWKVPYTHVLADRFLRLRPDLRYVHMTRDPLDMAFSGNLNQLKTWGPIYLNRDITRSPVDALSYWCAVHQRMTRLNARFPGRVFNLDYGQLIDTPGRVFADLFDFLEMRVPADRLRAICAMVRKPDTVDRHRAHDTSDLRSEDIEYLIATGYRATVQVLS